LLHFDSREDQRAFFLDRHGHRACRVHGAGLGRLCELHAIALGLETNVRTSWALIFVHMTRYWFTMQ
jgi:hypothetical protein